ncbi:MAG: EamA family transporter RarD, partial [Mesorhizobium sp.]
FVSSSLNDTALLIGCGPVTAVPLLLFAFGARLLRLSTIGIMQYIAPTIVFLIAVLIFGEPFGTVQAIAFGLIWAALAMYSWSMFSSARKTVAASARAA